MRFLGAFLPSFLRFLSHTFWFSNPYESELASLVKLLLLSFSLSSVTAIISAIFKISTFRSLEGLKIFILIFYLVLIVYTLVVRKFLGNNSFKSNKIKKPKNYDQLEGFILDTINGDYLQIENPNRGIFICGGAGSGKTASIINPILNQAGKKNYTGLVYDFKFPTLANQVKEAWKANSINQYYINFTDLNKSNRVNPIDPNYIKTPNHAREAAKTLITNLDFKAAQKRDYWIQSSEALLSASIWYFKKFYPERCHLPMVISFLLNPDVKKILGVLNSDIEVSNMASSILSSVDNEKQLSGIFSTLQNYLSILASPQIFWVLSKSEVNLNLNDPNKPSILVLGNDPTLSNTFSPLISLIASTALKMMNTQGKEKSIVLLDEAPTLFIPNFAQIPATARENKISTIYGVQDIAQMENLMSPSESEMIISNLGTAFYGRVTNIKTAERVSKIFGKYEQVFQSNSQSKSTKLDVSPSTISESSSLSYQQRDRITANDVINFQTGQFAGINAEGNKREFNEIFKYKNTTQEKIEEFNFITEHQIEENYLEILELGRQI